MCLSHLGFLNEEKYKTNCFSKCNSNENYFDNKTNYYYFDELNEYHCTKDYICPEKYNKIIIDKKKCIDECKMMILINLNSITFVIKNVLIKLNKKILIISVFFLKILLTCFSIL